MSQRIEKSSFNKKSYLRDYSIYESARDGFGAILDMLGIGQGDTILVPGYIGWSAREGSGVFDPISSRRITPVFYHMSNRLLIDVEDCKKKIEECGAKVLLVIHYFGFVDPSAREVIQYAKGKGIVVIEDAAHAMLTDVIGEVCGRDGDYTLYSLHKMLPVQAGGMVISNSGMELPKSGCNADYGWGKYDLAKIAKTRIENYKSVESALASCRSKLIKPLFSKLPDGVIPQTFPVLLEESNRDEVYRIMNEKGWGIVSLYHTMIENLNHGDFPDECWVSKHITNLPVHQDVNKDLIREMVRDFVMTVEVCVK